MSLCHYALCGFLLLNFKSGLFRNNLKDNISATTIWSGRQVLIFKSILVIKGELIGHFYCVYLLYDK